MELILITGPQAVGKMTVGKELEKHMDAELLYNHQTLDLFARFLGYTKEAFRLSDETRKNLFRAFVKSERNVVSGIIFTVVVAYNLENDRAFLKDVCKMFLQAAAKFTMWSWRLPCPNGLKEIPERTGCWRNPPNVILISPGTSCWGVLKSIG